MKFLSTYPNLVVVLKTKRSIINEVTGEKLLEQHPVRVKFETGVYETTDANIIKMMLDKLDEMKKLGFFPSYSVHPENEEKKVEKKDDIKIKDEIILEKEKEIEELNNKIAELSPRKKQKKSSAITNSS